ncbi:hypothetical protein N7508_004725 [Penicillium antarcticum]|uniref:uncharacterized protein n=1 Tax=Penicillium antarcticum TaxID=416450 RepID=UPI0023A49A15|nr:uncharacterized protein N7508_004725 [Penicillium antarcticum]KAJ5305710.1 hypothetical protein N7508_004725 [Penicillium antarcticum]
MKPFTLTLSNGEIATGRLSIPQSTQKPLLVCLHGGTHDAEYFDAPPSTPSPGSLIHGGFQLFALNRPGYGTGMPLDPQTNETYPQQQGKYLNDTILPALWKEYEALSGASALVLLAHSIGAMMVTITAKSYAGSEGYPLSSLIASRIVAKINITYTQGLANFIEPNASHGNFDPVMKDQLMLQIPGMLLADPEVRKQSARLNKPVPVDEIIGINTTWLQSWNRYSHQVKVPLKYGISEFDELWSSKTDALGKYRDAFPLSPRVECEIVSNALSYAAHSWLTGCCEFAVECSEWYTSKNKKT